MLGTPGLGVTDQGWAHSTGASSKKHLELIPQRTRLPSVPPSREVAAGNWGPTKPHPCLSGPILPPGHPSSAASAPLSCSGPPPPPPPPVPPPPTGSTPPPPPPLPAGGAQGASHDESSVSGLAAALAGAKLRRVQRVSVHGGGRAGRAPLSSCPMGSAFPHLQGTGKAFQLCHLASSSPRPVGRLTHGHGCSWPSRRWTAAGFGLRPRCPGSRSSCLPRLP